MGVSSEDVTKIGDKMEETLPKVITFFTELISSVRDWIVNNLPLLIQAGADMLVALIKRINVRIPSNPITKSEVIQQIKDDLGL